MSSDTSRDTGFFGHPTGLRTLFFTELWERFSFYGMKAMLFLFITKEVMEGPHGGLGIGEEEGGAISGLYNSFVYLLALPGGWLADRLIGQRKAVLWGGIIIALGHFSMALTEVTLGFFYGGLILIIVGTGLLKPNISTMVGELYGKEMGARRDAGFSIFYMAINMGAFVAPLACGFVRQRWGWHYGFGLAGIGMTLGVIWYLMDQRSLGDAGLHPKTTADERAISKIVALCSGLLLIVFVGGLTALHMTGIFSLTWIGVADVVGYGTLILVAVFLTYVTFFTGLKWHEQKKVMVIGILFVFTALFWSGFEQASTSLNKFAEDFTQRVYFGWEMPPEFLQAVNPLFIIALAPVFGALWILLASKNLNPGIPMKFALGLLQLSLAFFVLVFAASLAGGAAVDASFDESAQNEMAPDGGDLGLALDDTLGAPSQQKRVWPTWLCITYLLFTTGELCLSPVGLSSITKLSPPKFVSQMMGIWFIAAALGNLIAGRVGGMIEDLPHRSIFQTVALIVGAAGILLLVGAPFIQRYMIQDVD